MRSISSGFSASTSTGSYDLFGADISSRASDWLADGPRHRLVDGARGVAVLRPGTQRCQRPSLTGLGCAGCARGARLGVLRPDRPGRPRADVNRNSAPPPGARPTVMVPPCASTMPLTMYRPRPVPPRLLPRQKRVKTRFMDSSGMPGPSSLTVTAVPCRSSLAALRRGRGGRHVDGDGSLAVPHRVFQQVAEHLVDLVGVGPQVGQRLLDPEQEAVGGAARRRRAPGRAVRRRRRCRRAGGAPPGARSRCGRCRAVRRSAG